MNEDSETIKHTKQHLSPPTFVTRHNLLPKRVVGYCGDLPRGVRHDNGRPALHDNTA